MTWSTCLRCWFAIVERDGIPFRFLFMQLFIPIFFKDLQPTLPSRMTHLTFLTYYVLLQYLNVGIKPSSEQFVIES